jgi:Ca2+-binding RTX toxin-like protein
MNELSVELRVDIGGHDYLPHSFLIVTGPDGIERGYGFGPLEDGNMVDYGWIKDNFDHERNTSTGKIPLDVDSYNRLVAYINKSIANPPPYNLFFGSQCANWAVKGLVEAGIPAFASPNMFPDNFLRDVFESIVWNPYTQFLNIKVNDLFGQARVMRRIDPLALDLDGDGVETVGITADKKILFDHNSDGIRAATGWVKSDDALLVLDRNGNGSIDNGSELFGVDTLLSNGQKATTGFAALADLDSNRDGVFNSADAKYAQIQLWRDLDQDGMSNSGELQTLAEAGIASINLNSVVNRRDLGNGNVQTDTANFTRTDGGIGTAANLDFASNAFYREFGDNIALTSEAARMPNLRGAGMVRDLQEAASIDAKLIQDVNGLSGLSRVDAMNQLDQLLQDWAGTANFKTSQQRAADMGVKLLFSVPDATATEMIAIQRLGGGPSNLTGVLAELGVTLERYNIVKEKVAAMGRMISVLEAFNGQTFLDFPDSGGVADGTAFSVPQVNIISSDNNGEPISSLASSPVVVSSLLPGQGNLLRRSYATLKESVYADLVGPVRLKSYLDAVSLKIDASGISMDFTALDAKLDSAYKNDPIETFIDCLDLQKCIDPLSKMGWQGAAKLVGWASDIASKGQLDQLKSSLVIAYAECSNGVPEIRVGTTSADTISAGKTDDIVIGLSGNDSLYGNAGNDILDGGAGNDSLLGGEGNDVYLFNRGSGQDMVLNFDTTVDKVDVVQFAADITSTDVIISNTENNLVLSIKGTTDKLTIYSYFQNDAANTYRVEEIRFADGTVWNVDTVKALVLLPTAGNDYLRGYATADTINGGDGNDTLVGEAGNDVLNGDNGNDLLTGCNGNDVINGGAGDDTLRGENGNDILGGETGNDSLLGGEGNDLYLFGRGGGQDTVFNFDTLAAKVDVIQFGADIGSGDVNISRAQDDLVLNIKGTTDKLTIYSYFQNDAASTYRVEEIRFADGTVWNVDTIKALALLPTAGNDYLRGYATADIISGGEGNDTLSGEAGDDIVNGDNGNDYLNGSNGNDVLNGGTGSDSLYGGNGNDILDGGVGNDSLLGGEGNDVYLFGRGSGQDSINNNDLAAGKVDAVQFAADITIADVSMKRVGSELEISLIGTADKLTISSYFFQDGAGSYKLEEIRFADGTVWNVEMVKAMVLLPTAGNDNLRGYATADIISGEGGNDFIYAGDGNDTINGGEGADNLSGENGNDVVNGGAGNDTLYGDNGIDILDGGVGDDSLYGNAGTDILQGGAGNDYFSDSSGAALFDGGLGNDTINGGANVEIFVGGQGNDTYTTGAGNDILLFNKGDGQDSFAAGGTGNDTVSLGGSGLNYADLALAKSGTDLVLKVGAVDQITFRNWYASTPTRPIATLQVIAEAMDDFAQGGSDPLKDQRVERFNFTGLVETFDAARTANAGLSSWALTNALNNFSQGGSDTAAVGGDFAYQYGKNGTFAGMGVTTALNTLSDVNMGATSQALTAPSGQQSGAIRLS